MSVIHVIVQPGDEVRIEYAKPALVAPSTRLTLPEASALYRVSVRVLRERIASGKLEATKTGRAWTVERSAVESLFKPTTAANDASDPEDADLVEQLASQGVTLGRSR